jgi:FdrA protein
MTSARAVQLLPGAYYDSITLMQVSRRLADRDGVQLAQVAMATDLNRDLLAGLGFDVPAGVGAGDLLIAIEADGEQHLAAALASVGPALRAGSTPSPGPGAATVRPRTVRSAARSAARSVPGEESPAWVLISVPGPHAFPEAMDAVEAGLNVMVFSDNVSVAQEIRLKDAAAAAGTLVLGPDCGTAIIGGVGLGFANVVRPGPVGIVAASGTGAQHLTCLLDAAGVGISHCLGVGGRDLSAAVGGRGARRALAILDADPATELIVVVSKPADPRVAAELRQFTAELSTPVRFALLGPGAPDLTATADAIITGLRAEPAADPLNGSAEGLVSPARSWAPGVPVSRDGEARFAVLRGAFAGGTLCDEAMLIASDALGPIASNIPLPGAPRLGRDLSAPAGGHVMIDFGDDELTRGRPHPMIDSSLRADWILRQVCWRGDASPDRPGAGVIGGGVVLLLDVILGHGAHPDPAADLAPAIAAAHVEALASGIPLAVLVSLCGTAGDPQGLDRQATTLAHAGAAVYLSNAAAARAAVAMITGGRP